MNLAQYMSNPLGKGSSVLMIAPIRRTLDEEYQKIANQIKLTWYSYQDKYLIAHLMIPSKSVDKLFYDVLIEIDNDSIPKSSSVINGSNTRVFSNCPSFVYTYANVFNQKGDLIPWTKSKFNRKIFELDPHKRNPLKIENYEKSLYFAIKHITSNGRNYKSRINFKSIQIKSHLQIVDILQSSDDVLYSYKGKKKKEDAKKKQSLIREAEKRNKKVKNQVSSKSGSNKIRASSKMKKSKSSNKMKKL